MKEWHTVIQESSKITKINNVYLKGREKPTGCLSFSASSSFSPSVSFSRQWLKSIDNSRIEKMPEFPSLPSLFYLRYKSFQGCILSPCLFNLYAEYIMRNAGLEETQAGLEIAGRNINHLRYADDTTLMAEREEELKSPWWRWKRRVKKLV